MRPAAYPSGSYERIYRIVRRIPAGRVATYGQVAEMAGLPGHARQVGYALHALQSESTVPWHRVLNARGEISLRSWGDNHLLQRLLLQKEKIRPDRNGRIDLERYRWTPARPRSRR
jgi:methylated-DNA-protein-cysteine methyltransferase related protein